MSEFIKIGEVANLFNTLESKVPQANNPIQTLPQPISKKSTNVFGIVTGVILVGFIGYQIYLFLEQKRKDSEH